MYFWFSEVLTASFAAPAAETNVIGQLFSSLGVYTVGFWFITFSLFMSFLYLFIQAVNGRFFNVKLVFLAALLINIGLWIKRVVIVVPSLLLGTASLLPYPTGTYTPTWVEWTIVTATFVLPTLLYLIYIKLFPLIPIHELQVGELK